MAKVTLTEKKLVALLKQNTGSHFLDSGGAYGRHWERNQARTFQDEPDASVEFWAGDSPNFTLNLFHYLRGRIQYNARLHRSFHAWEHRAANEDKNWMQCMEEYVAERTGQTPTVYYSYNWENNLSQDIQFVRWDDPVFGPDCCLLQIHNGCDARSGLTSPLGCTAEEFLDGSMEGTVYCPMCHAQWYNEGSNTWKGTEYWPPEELITQLSLFGKEGERQTAFTEDWDQYTMSDEPSDDARVIYVEEHKAQCPHCKRAWLEAAA